MEINKYSSVIRSLVIDDNFTAWVSAKDKPMFCAQLADLEDEHPIIKEIVSGAINQIFSRKAENRSNRTL
ncbi:hypothetical protein ACMXYR_06335 [Neptuniibacter sp. QD29_5]|uniref:hypothetical protein n=1 Tax=Neptuniibacter sp. QD29_5 TaxID=3398207 RepID=UPI0039F6469D